MIDLDAKILHYSALWGLESSRSVISTPTSSIFRVTWQGVTAVLKILTRTGRRDEAAGPVALRHFGGQGAVHVLEFDEGAHLLEFADGRLTPLSRRFECLLSWDRKIDEQTDKLMEAGKVIAEKLLSSQQDKRVLHGDLHHDNILNDTDRGYLAIDAKGLYGERSYDVGNIVFNPSSVPKLVLNQERLLRTVRDLADGLQLEEQRLRAWVFAHGCLRTAWKIKDRACPEQTLQVCANLMPHLTPERAV